MPAPISDTSSFRAAYPELLARVRLLRDQWQAELLLIEDAGTGRPLLDDLKNEILTRPFTVERLDWRVHPYRPRTGKLERFAAQTAKLQAGNAQLPNDAPWLDVLRREITAFPNGRHDDQVDSVSQFLDWTTRGRSARNLVDRGGDRPSGKFRREVERRP